MIFMILMILMLTITILKYHFFINLDEGKNDWKKRNVTILSISLKKISFSFVSFSFHIIFSLFFPSVFFAYLLSNPYLIVVFLFDFIFVSRKKIYYYHWLIDWFILKPLWHLSSRPHAVATMESLCSREKASGQ